MSRENLLTSWPLLLAAVSLPVVMLLVNDLPERSAQTSAPIVGQDTSGEEPCGEVSTLVSDRYPLNTGPDVWGFARMGGVKVQACAAGTLQFQVFRKDVQNTPSRWEVYLGEQLLQAGEVSQSKAAPVEVAIPNAGAVSIIFANAYADPERPDQRRTLYLQDIVLR